MSVVMRMEMPEGCWGCPFGHYDWIWGDDGIGKMVCFCCLDGESEEDGHYLLETEQKRPSWCPIICSLPEGHGRLGDLDALADDVRSLWDYKTVDGITATTVLNQTLTDIRNCPTIVLAERSET